MSPSIPANTNRIPPQRNPFGDSAFGSPWSELQADVPTINEAAFRAVMAELDQVKWGGKGSIVITGDPGSGKTHLLGRLRRKIGAEVTYIYVRCDASAVTLWRHVRASVAGDLLKQEGGEPARLQRILRLNPERIQRVNSLSMQRALQSYAEGRNVHAASAWLRGEALPLADLALLGIGVEAEDEDRSRETEARVAVTGLLELLAPDPVMLCFDQVEALETYRGDEQGFHAMGALVAGMIDAHNHLLLVSCIIADYEDVFERLTNKADRDRWLQRKVTLSPISWEAAVSLVKHRLESSPDLAALRSQHAGNPIYPLHAEALQPLFAKNGSCLPRTLIQECKRLFEQLFTDSSFQAPPPLARQDFLQEVYTDSLTKARAIVTSLGAEKTLSESLPWLMQNSGCLPLGEDVERSQYAALAFRRETGEFAVSLCYARGNGLTARLKKIDRSWKPGSIDLYLLRDASVAPGDRGLQLLSSLKSRGVKEVFPLPEALAALQAIRNMIAAARSGDLRQDGQIIGEPEVTTWALLNLPAQLEQLREGLAGRPKVEPVDPVLPQLTALLKNRKVISAQAAATELSIALEEVSACASRHPMRFGVLAGPPMVLFQAIEGPSDSSHA